MLSLFILSGCKSTGELSTIMVVESDILSIKEGTVTSDGVSLIITNNSEDTLYYDEYYIIEKYTNNEWYEVSNTAVFEEPLYLLDTNSEVEIKIDWTAGYGPLSKGTYRLIKEVLYVNNDEFYTYVEFVIE